MNEARKSHEDRQRSQLARTMSQKANPVAVVAIGIYIPIFLTLVVVGQQYSEIWFVKRFLTGYGIALVALVLACVMLITVSLYERRISQRKDTDERNS